MKGRYTVREDLVLGEGLLGTHHAGLDDATGHPVTVTVLRQEFSGDPAFTRRFHREISRAGRIVHPNVVRTYGSGVWKGRLVYATETIDGKELGGARNGDPRYPSDEILRIAEGSARALLAAERYKVAPLHLRKSGIVITREGKVKLADLGLSRILGKEADYQRLVQDSHYLSPERTLGRTADVRSDLFALGVILYELATGRLPFQGYESKISYLYQLLNVAPVPPRDAKAEVPAELERLILRCLAKDPERRYPGAAAFLEDLQAVRRALAREPGAGDPAEDDSGDFEIDEDQVIGEGGMGTLFRGRQRSLHRAVAIKVIRDPLTANADFRKRFRREADLLAQVRDGNVVQVFGAGRWKGRLFYAMELVEGKDLRMRVAQGPPLNVEEILHIGQGVGKALRAAWSHKIVHRDIKPSNILLARDGTVKVTDFGVATCLRLRRPDSQYIVGTQGYLSPEQGAGEDVDIRSDIYSLGVVLFELAAGAMPRDHAKVRPPSLSGSGKVPPGVDAMIQRCLEKSPARRFQTPDELLTEILSVRQRLWARSGSALLFPSPHGACPESGRERFALVMALGDHETAVALAEREFGPASDEYLEASSRLAARAGLQRVLARDWAGAATAYREAMQRARDGRKAELLLAVEYCERLAEALPPPTPRWGTAGPAPDDSAIVLRLPQQEGRTS